MAVQYVVKQSKGTLGKGQYYGRAVHPSTVNLDTIASRIQRSCSMTKGDVLAVLTEMVTVMNDELQNSNKVKLDGFGTFYVGIRTKGAESEEKFTANENIKAFTINFLAEGHKQNGKMVRTFTEGITAVKAS